MLFSLPDMKEITRMPHTSEYVRWCSALDGTDSEAYDKIHDELNCRFDSREVDTSSWIPGSDWTGSVFEPVYIACNFDEVASALFFGLLVWQVLMDREDCWSFGRYEKSGVPIKGMTYFRIDSPS